MTSSWSPRRWGGSQVLAAFLALRPARTVRAQSTLVQGSRQGPARCCSPVIHSPSSASTAMPSWTACPQLLPSWQLSGYRSIPSTFPNSPVHPSQPARALHAQQGRMAPSVGSLPAVPSTKPALACVQRREVSYQKQSIGRTEAERMFPRSPANSPNQHCIFLAKIRHFF